MCIVALAWHVLENTPVCIISGGVSKSMLKLNEAIIDIKEG